MEKNQNNDKINETKISYSYETLWKSIIRPYHHNYKIKELGPTSVRCRKKNYSRRDFDILGTNGIY